MICASATPTPATSSPATTAAAWRRTGFNTIGGLPAGSYNVTLRDCGPRNDLDSTYRSPVAVSAGQTTQGIDVTMRPATSITGHVYSGTGTGTPLSSICVQALNADGSQINGYTYGWSETPTQTASTPSITSTPASSYVGGKFNGCAFNARTGQYYDGVADISQAHVPHANARGSQHCGVDAHLPSGDAVTTITGGPAANAANKETNVTFSFTANMAGATFECSVDYKPTQACTSPFDTGELTPGQHSFSVRADRA